MQKKLISSIKIHKKMWELKYFNHNTISFIFSLAKKRTFGGDIAIGEVKLKLLNFETNTVARCDCKLRHPTNKRLNSTVSLSIHVCEDGSAPFNAPDAGIVLTY